MGPGQREQRRSQRSDGEAVHLGTLDGRPWSLTPLLRHPGDQRLERTNILDRGGHQDDQARWGAAKERAERAGGRAGKMAGDSVMPGKMAGPMAGLPVGQEADKHIPERIEG